LARVQVVLVRPGTAANLGAVARVLRNTGLEALVLVSPGEWRTLECWRSAWGAHELLESARECATLEEALAGSALSVAFSGRAAAVPVRDVRDAAAELAGLPAGASASLVFGPESTGLSGAERALCGVQATIPSDPLQPSLNLSHAVMVAAYEVFRARAGPGAASPRRATHDEKQRMLGLLKEGLRAIEALPAENSEGYFQEWRALFQRADLTPKELRLLEHMARKMAQRVS
jgi:tRNA/rRNA methyltransferase